MTERASVRSLEDALLRALALELQPLGFNPRLKQQEFTLEMGENTWVVHVGFIRHTSDVDATLDIGVLLAAVEQRLAKTGWKQRGSATIGAELGNLVDRRPRRWTIETEADAVRVAREMHAELVKFGMDWLRRFSSPETVYDALGANDQPSWLLMPLHVKRCLIVVALATILRTKEQARAVAEECRTFLEARKEPTFGSFEEHSRKLLES